MGELSWDLVVWVLGILHHSYLDNTTWENGFLTRGKTIDPLIVNTSVRCQVPFRKLNFCMGEIRSEMTVGADSVLSDFF